MSAALLALDGASYGGSIRGGSGGRFTCPVHDDERPSLDIQAGHTRAVIANCKVCESAYTTVEFLSLLCEAIEVPMAVLNDEPTETEVDWGRAAQSTSNGARKASGKPFLMVKAHEYNYKDEEGIPLVQITRLEDKLHEGLGKPKKDFFASHFGTNGSVLPGIGPNERTPYLLQKFKHWRESGKPIYLVEGEETAKAIVRAGGAATTFFGGASGRLEPDWVERWFTGWPEVIVWADRDAAGIRRAQMLRKALKDGGVKVRAVVSATDGDKDDAVEHLAAGHPLNAATPLTKSVAARIGQPGGKPDTHGAEHAGPVLVLDAARPDPGEFTDAALAERIARELDEAGTPLRWNPGLGWLLWDGKRWRTVDLAAITEFVRRHVRAWFMREIESGWPDKTRFRALEQLQSRGKIAAVVDLMDGYVQCPIEAFDSHPELLNVQNGVVDLATGKLLLHSPEYGFTRITAAAYVPEMLGQSAAWEKAKQTLPADAMAYVMARLGQAVTGFTPDDDKVLFAVGGGANGKTTFLTPILTALGDFAGTVRQELLVANSNQHPEIFMDLRGRRLVWMDETAEGQINPQRLKRVVGTSVINARNLYKSSVEFVPTHCLIISTNHAPIVRETDRGTWRRLVLVRFPFVYGGPKDLYGELARKVDTRLRQQLCTPRSLEAVLADLVHEADSWFRAGRKLPSPPDSIRSETEKWREESDLIRQFVEEELEVDGTSHIPLSDLTQAFNEWCRAHGHNTVGHDTFRKRLAGHERLPDGMRFRTDRKRPTGRGSSVRHLGSKSDNPVSSWTGVRYRGD